MQQLGRGGRRIITVTVIVSLTIALVGLGNAGGSVAGYLIIGSAFAAVTLGLIVVRRRSHPASNRNQPQTPFQPGFDTSRQILQRRHRPESTYGVSSTEPVRSYGEWAGGKPAGHL